MHLACGRRILPWFSPKEEADQAESAAKRSLGREGSASTRPENSPNKAHRADRGGETRKKEKRFTPSLHDCPGLETGGAALGGRRKMGFRGG